MQLRSAAQPPRAQAPDSPLRSITAGYDIDRWPIKVAIRADEAIESWLSRAAGRYAITPRELIAEAGIEDRVQRPIQLDRLVREHADLLGRKLGCELGDIRAAAAEMLPTAAIIDYLIRYRATSRPVPAGTAFCPLCLTQPDPRWKREWASIFGIACTAHACLLVRTCPGCGEPPFSTASWLSPGLPTWWLCPIGGF